MSSNSCLNVLLASWQPLYHVYAKPSAVWTPRWIAPAARLFDGSHGDGEIFRALPHRLTDMFTPAFLAALRHPAARGDRSVTIDNSRHCAADLAAQGVHVRLVDVGAVDHFPSFARAAPRVLAWFERQR